MMKKTKIICTIGPSSWDPEIIRKMINLGMNCARVNGAFADANELDKVTKLVRDVSDKVSLMMDIKGPEVRLNKFSNPITIKPGDIVKIGNSPDSEIYPSNFKDLYKHLLVGQKIVIGDGDVELKIVKIENENIFAEVVFGEELKPGKSMNLPGSNYTSSILTDKDIENLKHSLKLGWDFVSASFVQNANAAREIKKYLNGTNMKLIAKIEDSSGLENLDEILNEVDGVMVARGGLGVELGLEKVPIAQKKIIERAKKAGKIVITATQMLESMINSPKPTRAEVTDVATAVLLGSDSLMLSGESSVGAYPVEAVGYMAKIALETEQYISPEICNGGLDRPTKSKLLSALAKAAAQFATEYGTSLKAILTISEDGEIARLIAMNKILQPVHAFVSRIEFARHLSIVWGVVTADVFNIDFSVADKDEILKIVSSQARSLGYVDPGDKVLLISDPLVQHNQRLLSVFEVVEV